MPVEQPAGGDGEDEQRSARAERRGEDIFPSMPTSEIDKLALRKAKEMASSAVSSVFLTLCGKSDEEDKFTG